MTEGIEALVFRHQCPGQTGLLQSQGTVSE